MADKSKTKSNGGGKRPTALPALVRQSGQSGHDGALSRALPQFRPDARPSCAPASRSSASRRPAPIFRPATAITSSSPSACATGIRAAGGVAFEFPVHPIQETGKRPTAALDRNLAYLGLVEMLIGYPLDGVVLTTGCDKTTPACLMAAATVNMPAIVLSGGPMLNGWHHGQRAGSGTVVWQAREDLAAGKIDYEAIHRHRRLLRALDRPLQHHGHRLDHECARRSARHVPAGLRRDPGALPRARPDRL